MKTVKVKRDELIERIRKNRDAHRAIFREAQEVYRQEVIKLLEQRLEDARNGRKIERGIRLQEPEDHTEDYDRVLTMLEMSVDAEIEISQMEFAQYVMDDWSWKDAWLANTAAYVQE